MALDPLSAALDLGTVLIERFFPDPAQRDAAKLEMLKMQQSGELVGMLAQTDINKVEAANPSLFTSGWRPFIGWVCGLGLTYQFLFYPVALQWMPKLTQLDMGTLLTLLGGLLGLGSLRTVEKVKGVAS